MRRVVPNQHESATVEQQSQITEEERKVWNAKEEPSLESPNLCRNCDAKRTQACVVSLKKFTPTRNTNSPLESWVYTSLTSPLRVFTSLLKKWVDSWRATRLTNSSKSTSWLMSLITMDVITTLKLCEQAFLDSTHLPRLIGWGYKSPISTRGVVNSLYEAWEWYKVLLELWLHHGFK